MSEQHPTTVVLGATGKTGSRRHSFVRPAWFMQNLSETFLRPINGTIVVPTADFARKNAFAWSEAAT